MNLYITSSVTKCAIDSPCSSVLITSTTLNIPSSIYFLHTSMIADCTGNRSKFKKLIIKLVESTVFKSIKFTSRGNKLVLDIIYS